MLTAGRSIREPPAERTRVSNTNSSMLCMILLLQADLYPETTVMFADVENFTPWSSMRDPSQVFFFLQTVYQGFDEIAKRRKVFKVETVGDVRCSFVPCCSRSFGVVLPASLNCSLTSYFTISSNTVLHGRVRFAVPRQASRRGHGSFCQRMPGPLQRHCEKVGGGAWARHWRPQDSHWYA